MRRRDVEAELMDAEQSRKDVDIMQPMIYAANGWSVDEILAMYSKKKGDVSPKSDVPPPSRKYVERLVARAQANREDQEEAMKRKLEEAGNAEPLPQVCLKFLAVSYHVCLVNGPANI